MELFKANISTIELARGSNVFCSTELMDKAASDPTTDKIETECKRIKAMLLLKISDGIRYNKLIGALKSGATLNCNEYLKKVFNMYKVICSYCPDQSSKKLHNRINLIQRGSSHSCSIHLL